MRKTPARGNEIGIEFERLLGLFHRLVILMPGPEKTCIADPYDKRERIKLNGLSNFSKSLIKTSHQSQTVAIPLVRSRVARVQFSCSLKLSSRAGKVPVIVEEGPSQRRVGFGSLFNFEGPPCCLLGLPTA